VRCLVNVVANTVCRIWVLGPGIGQLRRRAWAELQRAKAPSGPHGRSTPKQRGFRSKHTGTPSFRAVPSSPTRELRLASGSRVGQSGKMSRRDWRGGRRLLWGTMLLACAPEPAAPQPAAQLTPSATQTPASSAECNAPNPSDLDACVLYLRSCLDAPVPLNDEGRELCATAARFERSGDARSARRTYFTLIAQRPRSGYVPSAYLAFGELFFAEARTQPANEQPCPERGPASISALAVESYRAALNGPVGPAAVPLVVHYRLGQVYALGEDCPRASAEFDLASKLTGPGMDSPCARALISSARSQVGSTQCSGVRRTAGAAATGGASPCPTAPDAAQDGGAHTCPCGPGDMACAIRCRARPEP
jgi:hypothetical protein